MLQAHQRERVPFGPPIDFVPDARTVLAGKGSLRRARHRRALACSAPFRPDYFAMGGSGGNTQAPSDYSKRRTYQKPTTQNLTGLDRVAPYQFPAATGEDEEAPAPIRTQSELKEAVDLNQCDDAEGSPDCLQVCCDVGIE